MTAEIIVLITGILAILLASIGCIVPVIPGPILSFAALLIISIPAKFTLFSPALLLILGVAAVAPQLLDNLFPFLASKQAGAGKGGIWGNIIGMITGTFLFPPFGVIIGAFAGALAGEMIFNPENKEPLKASMGVFTGTLF